MVKFKHLKINECNTCGETTVVSDSIDMSYDEREIRYHTNGQRWERRRFLCGLEVTWTPNYENVRVTALCKKHKAVEQVEKLREKIAAAERSIAEEVAGYKEQIEQIQASNRHLL